MVAEFFDDGVKPENSYRVTLERGWLGWTTSDGGTVRVYAKEPDQLVEARQGQRAGPPADSFDVVRRVG